MDPATAALTIVTFGLQATHGIVKYYSSVRSATDSIKQTLKSASNLRATLNLIETRFASRTTLDTDIVANLQKSTTELEESFRKLDKTCKKIHASDNGNLKERATAFGKRATYPFREYVLVKIREECNEATMNLCVSLLMLDIDTGLNSQMMLENLSTGQTRMALQVKSIEGQVQAVSTGMGSLVSTQKEQRNTALLEWLSPLMGQSEEKIRQVLGVEARQDGPAHRLMQSSLFLSWFRKPGKTLLCTGGQGTGKTVTGSIVISKLQEHVVSGQVGLIYVFYDYYQGQRQSPENILAAFCQQLLNQDKTELDAATDLFTFHQSTKTRPSALELRELYGKIASHFTKIYVVIDAFDESPGGRTARGDILRVTTLTRAPISLLVFSRKDNELLGMLPNALHAQIETDEADIVPYIKARLSQDRRIQMNLEKDPNTCSKIIEALVPKARDMFLLAKLYVDAIVAKGTLRQMKAALQSLPEGLFSVYNDAMLRIRGKNEFESKIALRTMQWIVRAYRPLTIIELQHALAVQVGDPDLDPDGIPDIDQIVSACLGLVTVSKESGVVSFLHSTVQEYLKHDTGKHFLEIRNDIAQTCLTYLMFKGLTEFDHICIPESSRDQRYPLTGYALEHWGTHARFCSDKGVTDTVMKYLGKRRHTFRLKYPQKYMHAYEVEVPFCGARVPPICVAASFGLDSAIQKLLKGIELSSKNKVDLNKALRLTVANNLESTARILLYFRADLHAPNKHGVTALLLASRLGHEFLFKGILRTRSSRVCLPKATSDQPGVSFNVERELNSCTLPLLKQGAEANIVDYNAQRPLHLAARAGHYEVMEWLLNFGAEAKAFDHLHQTPLHVGATAGYSRVINSLLRVGADVNVTDNQKRTALHLAVWSAHTEVAHILLEKGANTGAADDMGETALHYAARLGNSNLFLTLLDHGADADILNHSGCTAAHYAAESDDVRVMAALLRKKCDIDILDTHSRNLYAIVADTEPSNNRGVILQMLEDESKRRAAL